MNSSTESVFSQGIYIYPIYGREGNQYMCRMAIWSDKSSRPFVQRTGEEQQLAGGWVLVGEGLYLYTRLSVDKTGHLSTVVAGGKILLHIFTNEELVRKIVRQQHFASFLPAEVPCVLLLDTRHFSSFIFQVVRRI